MSFSRKLQDTNVTSQTSGSTRDGTANTTPRTIYPSSEPKSFPFLRPLLPARSLSLTIAHLPPFLTSLSATPLEPPSQASPFEANPKPTIATKMASPTATVTTQASPASAPPSSITGPATINASSHTSTIWPPSASITPSTTAATATVSTASRPPCHITTSGLNTCNPHWSNGRWVIYGFLFGVAILAVIAGLFYITLHCRERRRRSHRRHNRRGRRRVSMDESLIAREDAYSAQPITQVRPAYHSSRAWGLEYGYAVGL